ncbi:MAG: peptidase M14 family protein, partial [archaeon]
EKHFKEKTWMGFMPEFPEEYVSGIGKEGIESIRKFVENGGTLVAFDTACDLPIDEYKLQVSNTSTALNKGDFYCPGSTLWAEFDVTKPMAYGMPERGLVFFWNSPILQILNGEHDENYVAAGRYPERNILRSGWLIGEKHLRRKPVAIDVKCGKGRIALIGFRPQHRAQTDGTYKILFNCLLS